MEIIYKYPLQITDFQAIIMPENPHILSVQVQDGTPCLWALINNGNSLKEHTFRIFGTGNPIEKIEGMLYIGTFQLLNGRAVYHVFFDFLIPKKRQNHKSL